MVKTFFTNVIFSIHGVLKMSVTFTGGGGWKEGRGSSILVNRVYFEPVLNFCTMDTLCDVCVYVCIVVTSVTGAVQVYVISLINLTPVLEYITAIILCVSVHPSLQWRSVEVDQERMEFECCIALDQIQCAYKVP